MSQTIVAAVTKALKQLILNSLTVDGAEVMSRRPDQLPTQEGAKGVNVFLYHVSPNATLRNEGLRDPYHRPADGKLPIARHRPPVALDLYYLLSFYGDEAHEEPELLLGAVADALYNQGKLNHSHFGEPKHTEADRWDLDITLTPVSLNMEGMARIWSCFPQTPYRLTMAWLASGVLIESESEPEIKIPRVKEVVHSKIKLAVPIAVAATPSKNTDSSSTDSSTTDSGSTPSADPGGDDA